MLVRASILGLIVTLALPVAMGEETVSLSLLSPDDGQTVPGYSMIQWEIQVEVTSAGNDGLALFSVDLVQDGANPATLDIPPAEGVPALFGDFSRPDGISNPGEDGATSGYVGVQRGTAGAMNLIQVGGGQNTFGVPGQNGIGEDATVDTGVALGGAVVAAQGSFRAPTAAGTYTFSLANGLANVLEPGPPGDFWPVSSATVSYGSQSISFTVNQILGDLNCDGSLNAGDIDPFVLALTDAAGYAAAYPNCNRNLADANEDGLVNAGDIDGFVNLVVGP